MTRSVAIDRLSEMLAVGGDGAAAPLTLRLGCPDATTPRIGIAAFTRDSVPAHGHQPITAIRGLNYAAPR
jgi:hypothetical protein